MLTVNYVGQSCMQDGAVVEEGSHEELMQRGAEGAYHSLVALQAAASTADTDVAAAGAMVPTADLVDVIRADADLAFAATPEAVAGDVSQAGGAGAPGSARNQPIRRTSRSVAVAAKPAPTSCKKAVESKSGEKEEQIEAEELVRCPSIHQVLHIGRPR